MERPRNRNEANQNVIKEKGRYGLRTFVQQIIDEVERRGTDVEANYHGFGFRITKSGLDRANTPRQRAALIGQILEAGFSDRVIHDLSDDLEKTDKDVDSAM